MPPAEPVATGGPVAGSGRRWRPPAHLIRHTVRVGSAERTYWTATGPVSPGPILLVFPGSGLTGPQIAGWTGLHTRARERGMLAVFSEPCQEIWDGSGGGRRHGLDDLALAVSLLERLVPEVGVTVPASALVGQSKGAYLAEPLARCTPRLATRVSDVGALAGYLQMITWAGPDLTPERDRRQLEEIHRMSGTRHIQIQQRRFRVLAGSGRTGSDSRPRRRAVGG